MNPILIVAAIAAAGGLSAPAVTANPGAIGLSLQANVETFCRLSLGDAIVADDGSVGAVRETCNTPGGYMVQAAFANLASGTVRADSDTSELDRDGNAIFTSNQARRRTRFWSVVDGVRTDAAQPVIVRFSITPL